MCAYSIEATVNYKAIEILAGSGNIKGPEGQPLGGFLMCPKPPRFLHFLLLPYNIWTV